MKYLRINLKYLLEKSQLSENALARQTGISQQIINRIISGTNTNPKIATINPLANYFRISIGQLIDEDLTQKNNALNTTFPKWHEIGLIDVDQLKKISLTQAVREATTKILVDISSNNQIFAIQMKDTSMDPKFSEGTLLIFELGREPSQGDFVLLYLPDNQIVVRQVFIKNEVYFKKCFNPHFEDYELTSFAKNTRILGVLVQSRTNYTLRD